MNYTQEVFDVLVHIENHQNIEITQADLEKICDESNKIISRLKDDGMIEEYKRNVYVITEKGYNYLEPYKVKRAILIAAGFGSRMAPVTLHTPKPLVKVHNKRIIETIIDALLAKDITEIHIVRGYLGKQFDELLLKYPTLKFYTNTKYENENNISSALLVKDLYQNAYVLDADLYLKNPNIIRKYEYCSNYLGMHMDKTDDWRFIMKDKKAVGMTIGGDDCYQMVGLSFWTKKDGERFREDILDLYNKPDGKGKYWDDVPLGNNYNKHYEIYVRPCTSDDIIEIDTFEELQQIDPIYAQ